LSPGILSRDPGQTWGKVWLDNKLKPKGTKKNGETRKKNQTNETEAANARNLCFGVWWEDSWSWSIGDYVFVFRYSWSMSMHNMLPY